jgi:AcrR family transcriptional regulator
MIVETRKPVESGRSTSPDQTRERILIAARDVIGRKGKRGATTREIADVAGVNEATLFRHFGTKEALLVACAQHFCGFEELAGVAGQLTGDLANDLLALGRVMLTRFESLQDMIRWSLVETEYEKDIFAETAWRPQLAIMAVMTVFMQRRIDAGELRGDAQRLAMVFLGLVFMHALGRKKFPDSPLHRGDPEDALCYYVDVFLNGVRKP